MIGAGRGLTDRRIDLAAVGALILIGIFFFWDFLFSSKNFYFRDILNFHYPLRKVLIEAYARGELPLWNPFIYLGQPMLANPNYLALYPTNLLHTFLSFNYAFKLHFLIHPILGGIGFYFLARRFGLGHLGAFGGAFVYQFSGTVLSFLNLFNLVPVVALMPWLAWAFLGALTGPAWLPRAVGLGALLALQVLSVEPLLFQGDMLVLAAVAAYVLLESTDRRRTLLHAVKVTAAAGAVGIGLSAAQVLPTLELMRHSARGAGYDFMTATGWSMHPLDFLNMFIAHLFGTLYVFNNVNYWGEGFHASREPYLVSYFIGTTALLLAGVSFLSARRRLQLTAAALVALCSFFALGRHNPVYAWLYNHLGIFQYGRFPSKYFLAATLGLALLAALGLEVVERAAADPARRRRLWIAAACGLAVAAALLATWGYWGANPEVLDHRIRSSLDARHPVKDFPAIQTQLRTSVRNAGIFLLAASALVALAARWRHTRTVAFAMVALAAAEILPANLRLSPTISDADVDFVAEVNTYIREKGPREPFRVVPPTLLQPLPDVHMTMPNRAAAWLTLFFRMSGQPFYGIMQGIEYSVDHSVDHLNTRESVELWRACSLMPQEGCLTLLEKLNSPLVLAMSELQDPRLQQIAAFDTRSEAKLRLYWLDATLPRAYFASGVRMAPTPQNALLQFGHRDFPFGNTVVLEGQDVAPRSGSPGTGSAKVLEYRSQRVVCEVEAKVPGYLVLLDSYYPGWRAYLEGREAPIRRANYAFRAVEIPAGRHRVEFVYAPRVVYVGLAMTLATLGFALLVWVRSRRRRPVLEEKQEAEA